MKTSKDKALALRDNRVVTITFFLFVLMLASVAKAETVVPAGDVYGTWQAEGSPYIIEGDIVVPNGQVLIIEPGVTVSFASWYTLTVNGTLGAKGKEDAPILFTADTSWVGIRFIGASDNSILENVIVEKGQASGAAPKNRGGGIYVQNSSPTIRNSTIRDNYAKYLGGGIYLENSGALLEGNIIQYNQVGIGPSAGGGGIAVLNSTSDFIDNVIADNFVYVAGSYSTPSGVGGGIYVAQSYLYLFGNLLVGNSIEWGSTVRVRGGAIYAASSDLLLVNNTLVENTVGTGGGVYVYHEGDGIYVASGDVKLVNTILWKNEPEQIYVDDTVPTTVVVAFSNVQGEYSGVTGQVTFAQGNIDEDPRFFDPMSDAYQLLPDSPVIDKGTAYYEWQGEVLVDLSPGDYSGIAPDMGAFEFMDDDNGGGDDELPTPNFSVADKLKPLGSR